MGSLKLPGPELHPLGDWQYTGSIQAWLRGKAPPASGIYGRPGAAAQSGNIAW